MQFLLPALRIPSSSQAGKLQTLGSLALVAVTVALGMDADRKRESPSQIGGRLRTGHIKLRAGFVACGACAELPRVARVHAWALGTWRAAVCDQRGFRVLVLFTLAARRIRDQWIGSEGERGASQRSGQGTAECAEQQRAAAQFSHAREACLA